MRSRASISLPSSSAIHRLGVDAGGGELVHEDVRDRLPVAADPFEEAVAAADDEPFCELEADLLADPVDPRAR